MGALKLKRMTRLLTSYRLKVILRGGWQIVPITTVGVLVRVLVRVLVGVLVRVGVFPTDTVLVGVLVRVEVFPPGTVQELDAFAQLEVNSCV